MISIHALVKRATFYEVYVYYECYYFNPRPREEGDCACIIIKVNGSYFNPRPREEGDRLLKQGFYSL